MQKMRFFVDTHDRADGTFPETLTDEQFDQFFAAYQKVADDLGVIVLEVKVGLEEGRAFCLTMAPDADTVRRAHEAVGLPFGTITEVRTATPGSLFFQRAAA